MKQHLAKHRKPKYTQSEDFHSQLTRLSFNIIWLSCAVIAVFLVVGITDQAFNAPRPQQTNLYPDPTGTGALEQYPLPSGPVVAPTTRYPSSKPSPAGMSTPMPVLPSPATQPPHHSQPPKKEQKKVQLPVPLPSATVVIVIPEPTPVPIPTPSPTCRRGNTDYGYSA